MTTIIAIILGILAGAIIGVILSRKHYDLKYKSRYIHALEQLKIRTKRLDDNYDAWGMYNHIWLFVQQKYREHGMNPSEGSQCFDSLQVRSFLRYIHGAGCRFTVEEASRLDVEKEADIIDRCITGCTKARNHDDLMKAYGY